VVTGEGRLDEQSLHGKVVGALTAGALQRRTPVLVLAGQVALDEPALRGAGVRAFSLSEYAGSVRRAIDDAANQLAGLAHRAATELQE
jgi:glycerate kinase